MKPGDIILTGIKAQGIVSRAIKMGSILRYQPGVARAATAAQVLCLVAAIALSVILGWSVLGAAAALAVAVVVGIALVWVIAAVAGDHSAYWARFSHAALVTESIAYPYNPALGRVTLTEALKRGVVQRRFAYPDRDWHHIPVAMSDEDREQVLAFARAVVDAKTRYGFVVFATLAVYCITASITWLPTIVLHKSGTAICSGFVADALTRAGVIWPREPLFIMPADIAAHFGVE